MTTLHLPVGLLLAITTAAAQAPHAGEARAASGSILRQFNTSLQELAARVSPAVVQIQVTGYGPVGERGEDAAGIVTRQHSIGSGVILDGEGYIMTNAHVVDGAQRIRVEPTIPPADSKLAPIGHKQVYEAKLVGIDKDTDLALIKIEGHGLPTLPLGDGQPVHPGEFVLAVGSPQGLQNSVTIGVISSVARQPNPDLPMEFIQTDAPINHGNSGGPLVDMDGFVVGLNTFIFSEGGGSEGLGFAIPARTLRFVYDSLRAHGHVSRIEIQAYAQTLNPALAAGLGLTQDWGVVISDVAPGGPAESAGLQAQDVVLSVDGYPTLGLPSFSNALNIHPLDTSLKLEVLRGTKKMALTVPALPRRNTIDSLASLVNPANRLGRLGVFGADYSQDLAAALPPVRLPSGVVVVALSPSTNAMTTALRVGDIIHAINRAPIVLTEQLMAEILRLPSGAPGVLTVERQGKMLYLAFEME